MEGSRSNPRGGRRLAWAVRGASGLAVASAVSVAAAADGPRAVVLLPPRVGEPTPATVIARGAADDNPLATTPVTKRPAAPPSGGLRPLVPQPAPAVTAKSGPPLDWTTGIDPNVIPAGGSIPAAKAAPVRLTAEPRPTTGTTPHASPKLTPPPPLFTPGEPNPLTKGVEAFKSVVTPDATPAGGAPPEPRSPAQPLQGTAANGAPVLAGPPAWRWYGYGTVTPGANPYAPSGQYPRGSANWHSVTKATPGAFPVPVVNPYRGGPGAEPPTYAGTPAASGRVASTTPPPQNGFSPLSPPRFTPTPVMPPPTGGMRTTPTEPTALMPPPNMALTPMPVSVMPPPPAFTPIPLPPVPAVRAPEPLAVGPAAEPVVAPRPTIAPPPILPPLSVMPSVTAVPPPIPLVTPPPALPPLPLVAPASAPALAPAPAEDEVRWQSNPTHRPGPPAGTWLPPAERARPAGEPGASAVRQPVARGQIGDEVQQPAQPADPVSPVVQAVCRGRATGIDVRHTGPRQVTICFEARTPTDATALVRDLSARPELAPYEINYCVLVK